MATSTQDNPHYYAKYQAEGTGNIAQFCRQEQINYDNFIHYCTRQKRKNEDLPLAPVAFSRTCAKAKHEKGVLSDVRIHYPNGVSLQLDRIPLHMLAQLIHLSR